MMKPFIIDITLPVSGMSCAACAVSAESMLKAQNGVISATVNYAAKSVKLEYQPDIVGLNELQLSLKSIGYDLVADSADKLITFEKLEKARLDLLRRKLTVAAIFSFPVFIMSMLIHHPPFWLQFLMLGLTIPVIFYAGRSFYITAWNLALKRQTSMDTLVAMGTGAAFLISLCSTFFPDWFTRNGLSSHIYYESAVVIITLILLGRFLEDRSRNKASAAIKSLMNLQPETVNLLIDGKEQTIALKNVGPDDLLLVKPGDTVPVDGIITEGSSWIDESMMSGEPLPVFKQAGDKVLAGTGNQQGAITVKTFKTGHDTVLSRIIGMVEEAQSSKPPIQKLVDRISAVFVPVVILISLITFFLWYFTGPSPSLTYAIVTSISVLIIACPCALGLATPTALIVAIGRGAANGILYRDASGIEIAGKTDTLVIDKTGTLTTGRPVVENMFILNDSLPYIPVFAGLSRLSSHPLSQAVNAYFQKEGMDPVKVNDFQDIPGKGVSGTYKNIRFLAGSPSLLAMEGIEISESEAATINMLEQEALSLIIFASSDKIMAIAATSDPLRESSKTAVAALKALGINVIMLTGDHASAAARVAAATGISTYKSGMTPQGKAEFIQQLQLSGHKVAMAGDGINDTIALASADVGIAMGSGSDASIETAAITITGSSLHQIVGAIQLSARTNKIIKQNLFWAFFYNLLMLPIAAGLLYPFIHELLNPMIASAAMALSSVSVVANSLRLRKNQSY
ncbi:MAG: copper-translocating P-type ATPase [Lentimicrobiaceae bacterium]|nr:copper-translocating P-type ATPase [Lentimicrobiaceae bacterium]